MLELIKKLKQLRDLVDPRYSGMLYAVVQSALKGDFPAAHDGTWDLGKTISHDQFFGVQQNILAEVPAEKMDEAFAALETKKDDATTAAFGTWLVVIQLVIELLTKLKK